MADVYTLSSSALPRDVRVVGFRGSEAISRLYSFEVYLATADGESDLGAAVGTRATLTIHTAQRAALPFTFHGILAEVELAHESYDASMETGPRALLRAVIVPKMWWLGQTRHSRIFTSKSVPDILRAVFEDNGLSGADYAFRLVRAYAPESHVCQYDESDFAFISRWMEREGIYYFFEQTDDKEKLVLVDDRAAHDDLAPTTMRFSALVGDRKWGDSRLATFACRRRMLPSNVRVDDCDYANPRVPLIGAAPVASAGRGEISIHAGRFFSSAAGQRLAAVRAEELRAREVVFEGTGTSLYLRPGYTFKLDEHPRPAFNASYLAIAVNHRGVGVAATKALCDLIGLRLEEEYHVEVTAIPSDVQFRAESTARWPRIDGSEHGVVDGPADSDYAQIDAQGRYLVRIAFDENAYVAGKASTWVRMMQPHGGTIEGFHFPLRKGTEVLFSFLGGDPDRPVISGVVPNTVTPSPVTSGNHTRNVIQTGGHNRLELEDLAGQERITLSTPYSNSYVRMGAPNEGHSMIIHTKGPTFLHAGGQLDISAGRELIEDITGDVIQKYHGGQATNIEKGGRYEAINSGGLTETITGTVTEIVTGTTTQTIDAGGTFTQTVDGGAPASQTFTGTYHADVTGAVKFQYDNAFYLKTTNDITEVSTSGSFDVTAAQGISITANGAPVHIVAPNNVLINAPDKEVTINGEHVNITAADVYGTDFKNSLELYYFRGYVGRAFKAEAWAFPTATVGIDLKFVLKFAFSGQGLKFEQQGAKLEKNGEKFDLRAMTLKEALVALKRGALGFNKYGLVLLQSGPAPAPAFSLVADAAAAAGDVSAAADVAAELTANVGQAADAVADAERAAASAQTAFELTTDGLKDAQQIASDAQDALDAATDVADLGRLEQDVLDAQNEVTAAEQRLQTATDALKDAQDGVTGAKQTLADLQNEVKDAQEALAKAEDEAKAAKAALGGQATWNQLPPSLGAGANVYEGGALTDHTMGHGQGSWPWPGL